MIELSVLLISYNNEKYIEDTLKSLLKQKCSFNFEIVVGDDCSTDKTFEIINYYANKHPTIFNAKQNSSQLGILGNFKATLDRCAGNFIFNFDGDDVVKSADAFEKIVTVLKENPKLGFVDSGYDRFLTDENITIEFSNKKSINASKEQYKEFITLGKVIPVGICFNRELLYKYVDFDYYIKQNITIEDYPILVDMVMHCDFIRINEPLHIYRVHSSSYSHKKSFDRIYLLNNQMLKLFNHFKAKYNFSEKLTKIYLERHYKSVLFNAGKYENKEVGAKSFKAINNKTMLDFIHYLASQYPLIRNIIRFKKKIYFKFLK